MDIKEELYIKRLDEESYSSVSSYLNELISISNHLYDPAVIILDGKKYIIDKFAEGYGKGFSIVEELDDSLKTYAIALDPDNKLKIIVTDEYEIELNFEDEDIAIKKVNTNDLTQEALLTRVYPNGMKAIIYTKADLKNNLAYDLKYDITNNRNTIESQLNWLQYKTPDIIDFMRLKNLKYKDISTYLKINDEYRRANVRLPILGYLCIRTNSINKETMSNIVTNYGFKMEVPTELTSIASNTNENIKRLELISNAYEATKNIRP